MKTLPRWTERTGRPRGTLKFFESLIVNLLLVMGYGGASEDAVRTLGQSGDNGVDGC